MVDDDNSVYDADISTLNILKEYAGKFNSLKKENIVLNQPMLPD